MPEFLYHYTDLKALQGILKNGELEFHGRRFDSMNDPLDCMFAARVIIPQTLNLLANEQDLSDVQTDYEEMYPYLVSLSEAGDDSSMWKHYGSSICIKLKTEEIQKNSIEGDKYKYFFDKCVYLNELDLDEQHIKPILDNAPDFENIPAKAQYISAIIKRDAFAREKEWRMVQSDYKTSIVSPEHGVTCTEIPVKVDVEFIRDGDYILYKKFILPKTALAGIIIHTSDPEQFHRLKNHINILLLRNQINPEDVEIRQTSDYPL